MKRLDLAGQKIGKLTVIGYGYSYIQPSGQKRAMWLVKCECGTEKHMSTSTLCHGNTISCGCQGKINRVEARKKKFGKANEHYLFLQYKSRSIKRFGDFELTKKQFETLIYQNCSYCDSPPEMRYMKRSAYGTIPFNGIDRIDSAKCYSLENCVTCCKICNMMKMDLSLPLFLDHIKKIYENGVEKRLFSKNNQ